ncbi:hypothetical protein ABW19_dt0209805 [Dactylella cylindrospora]|nr:hypothetical protein ABW19_dt0209805 [Dactylella cylindrospora]
MASMAPPARPVTINPATIAPIPKHLNWNTELAAKVEDESKRLQKLNNKGAEWVETHAKLPALRNMGPFPVAVAIPPLHREPSPIYRGGINFEATGMVDHEVGGMFMPSKVGLLESLKASVRWITFPLRQLLLWIIMQAFLVLTLGFGKKTRFYSFWAHYYVPAPGGFDPFGVRPLIEANEAGDKHASANTKVRDLLKVKKRVQWNPATGKYQTVRFRDLTDKNPEYERFPGETAGIDPEELEMYQHLTEEQITIQYLGLKVIRPMMFAFEVVVKTWWLLWFAAVIVAFSGSGLLWIAEMIDALMELEFQECVDYVGELVGGFVVIGRKWLIQDLPWYSQRFWEVKQVVGWFK